MGDASNLIDGLSKRHLALREEAWHLQEASEAADHLPLAALARKLERGAETETLRIGGGAVLTREECAAALSAIRPCPLPKDDDERDYSRETS